MSLLSVQAAQARVVSQFQPVETETLPLDRCAGRVLAASIVASDLPLFDNSSVDGFAVLASDVEGAASDEPRLLRVVGDIPAGHKPDITLQHGQAARIMTGAPMPDGADAVVMVEHTDVDQRRPGTAPPVQVSVMKAVHAGENVRTRGMDVKRGSKVLFTGQRLRPQDLGMLAMLGIGRVDVFRKPRAAL